MPTLFSLFSSYENAKQCMEEIKEQGLSKHIRLISHKQWTEIASDNDCNQNIDRCQDNSNAMMNIFDFQPRDISVKLIKEGVPQPRAVTYREELYQGHVLCMVKDISPENQEKLINIMNQRGAIATDIFPYSYPTDS